MKVEAEPTTAYLTIEEYEVIAGFFEDALENMLRGRGDGGLKSLELVSSKEMRTSLVSAVAERLRHEMGKVSSVVATHSKAARQPSHNASALEKLSQFMSSDVEIASLASFVRVTVDAFFDNDLLHTTRLFMENAKGSFGLCVASSLDAWRQVCFAAR